MTRRGLGLAACGLSAGLLGGLLGVGGGFVVVPLMVAFFAFAQKRAQATSLAMIIATGTAGVVPYALSGEVVLAPAAAIVAGGLVGSAVGTELVHRMSEGLVRLVFAVVVLAAAVRMAIGIDLPESGAGVETSSTLLLWCVIAGVGMGLISALVGIGGGLVIVPVLQLGMGFTPQQAQATSLLVIIPIAAMGAWRLSRKGYTDWRAAGWLALGSIVGAPLGGLVAVQAPGRLLQVLFAVLLTVIFADMLRRVWRERRSR